MFPNEPRSQSPIGLNGTDQPAGEFSLGLLTLLFRCTELLPKETVLTTTLATAGDWPALPEYPPEIAILGVMKMV